MEVDLQYIQKAKEIEITGEEPWLSNIFQTIFDKQLHAPFTKEFSARVIVHPLEYDVCRVIIKLTYTTDLTCGRCLEPLPWRCQIDKELSYYNMADPLVEQSDVNLTSSDLDRYYLNEGILNLQDMLNELILLEIPENPRHETTTGSESEPLYTTEDGDEGNPFAVLAKLKN